LIVAHNKPVPQVSNRAVTLLPNKYPVLRIISPNGGLETKRLRSTDWFPVEMEKVIGNGDVESVPFRCRSVFLAQIEHPKTRTGNTTSMPQVVSKGAEVQFKVLEFVTSQGTISIANRIKIGDWYIAPVRNPEHLRIGISRVQEPTFLN
jgi:hypothetical protein